VEGGVTAVATLADRVAGVRRRIDAVAGGRRVTLVAVTKGFGRDTVAAARAAGLDDLGESYAHELVAKADAIGDGGRWHFLGAVQRRKVRHLAPVVALWQSVDRLGAGREIARHAPGASVLVQVNVTGLANRNGCTWDDPRAEFRRLAVLARSLGLREVSTGMSGDLEVAVEEGSTMVRVGQALFGPRPVPDRAGRRNYPAAQGGS
jgi:PLP dependent protein